MEEPRKIHKTMTDNTAWMGAETKTTISHKLNKQKRSLDCTIMYHNVQSLKSKLEEVRLISRESKTDVICCVETWLDGSHNNTEIAISDYQLVRKDRSNKPNRGGVCVYSKKHLNTNVINVPMHDQDCTCENLWVTLKDKKETSAF